MEGTPQPIGDLILEAHKDSRPEPSRRPRESTPKYERAEGSKGRPMIIPREMPDSIIAKVLHVSKSDIYDDVDYQGYIKHVLSSRKTGANWDEYASRIDPILREKWAEILRRCRQEGFVFGYIKAIDGVVKIIWAQRVEYALREADRSDANIT
jgi:hypothetical protein